MSGHQRIRAERARQVEQEGFSSQHDDGHTVADLVSAAACYGSCMDVSEAAPRRWPWGADDWKPKDRLRNLERAGALYLAAAERAERHEESGARQRMAADAVASAIDRIEATAIRERLLELVVTVPSDVIARLSDGRSTRDDCESAAAAVRAAQQLLSTKEEVPPSTADSFIVEGSPASILRAARTLFSQRPARNRR
jgi:hypothetical protein